MEIFHITFHANRWKLGGISSGHLPPLLGSPVGFTSHKVFMVCQTQSAVFIGIDKAEGRIEIESNTDGIDGNHLQSRWIFASS